MVRHFRNQLIPAAWATALFAVVFLVDVLSPITTSLDSRWSVPAALSLLDHRAAYVDDYITITKNPGKARFHGLYIDYAVECVAPDRTIVRNQACSPGHYYSFYPAAVSAVAAPVLLALRVGVPVMSPLLLDLVELGAPVPRSFVEGDFIQSREFVEVVIATFFVAMTAIVVFLSARLFLPDAYAAFLGLLLAFATPAWSSASRALWQHAPSMFFISTSVYMLLLLQQAEAEEESSPWAPVFISLAAVSTALAYVVRPTNSLWVVAVSLFVVVRHRRYLPWYALGASPIAAGFLIYNFTLYHRIFPTYFSLQVELPKRFSEAIPMLNAWAGSLVSPSRGVFIYSPIFCFSIWGMVVAVRERWYAGLAPYLCGAVVANWVILGFYPLWWWAGHSYGPRYFSDVSPLLVLFIVPVLARWRASAKWRPVPATLFFVLLCASVFIHSRGARSWDVWRWNSVPTEIDHHQARLWDWRDPQFLRGLWPAPKFVADSRLLAAADALMLDQVEGSLDLVDDQQIAGWAWDRSRPNAPIPVEIFDGTTPLAIVTADLFREDLVEAQKGNGAHGFSYYPHSSSQLNGKHTIRVLVSGKELVGSPKAIGR